MLLASASSHEWKRASPVSSASLPAVDSAAADAPAAPSQADGPLPADATMAEDNEPAPLVPLWPESDTAGADDAADPVVHPVPPVTPEDR